MHAAGGAYGSMALDFNNGYLAAASSTIYGDGVACGGCYRMRCKNDRLCRSQGTTVIVTDQMTNSNKTDLVLSRKAYMALAKRGMGKHLLKNGAIDVEYKRYPCDFFNNKNLSLRVEDSSKNPSGFSDFSLKRNHSAVWDVDNVPNYVLIFEFGVIKESSDWVYIFAKNVIPTDWKPGMIYDTGVQITEIKWESCSAPKCPEENW
ncbi:Expansin-like protein [Melia azedarach]|uniref:Expansin-like protein n=1 Tax=Melia azedarach TaxID=155640 RepID=A0ACC1XWR6_MELAZ|nr:Expansin-like protein [Melia azedarach]